MDFPSIRRRLIRAKAKANEYRKGHGNTELNLLISESRQKLRLYEFYINALAADMDFQALWAKGEFNPIIRDIFGKLRDLVIAHIELRRKLLQSLQTHRRHWKVILKEEEQTQQLKRNVTDILSKLRKLEKQQLQAMAKGDTIKFNLLQEQMEQLQYDLEQAERVFAHSYSTTEMSKHDRVRQLLEGEATAQIQYHHAALVLAEAQLHLARLMSSTPAHLTSQPAYEDGPHRSDLIVCQAVRKVHLEDIFLHEESDPAPPSETQSGNVARGSISGTAAAAMFPLRPASSAPKSALEVVHDDGRTVQDGLRLVRPQFPGVPDPGQPLVGSGTLRKAARASSFGATKAQRDASLRTRSHTIHTAVVDANKLKMSSSSHGEGQFVSMMDLTSASTSSSSASSTIKAKTVVGHPNQGTPFHSEPTGRRHGPPPAHRPPPRPPPRPSRRLPGSDLSSPSGRDPFVSTSQFQISASQNIGNETTLYEEPTYSFGDASDAEDKAASIYYSVANRNDNTLSIASDNSSSLVPPLTAWQRAGLASQFGEGREKSVRVPTREVPVPPLKPPRRRVGSPNFGLQQSPPLYFGDVKAPRDVSQDEPGRTKPANERESRKQGSSPPAPDNSELRMPSKTPVPVPRPRPQPAVKREAPPPRLRPRPRPNASFRSDNLRESHRYVSILEPSSDEDELEEQQEDDEVLDTAVRANADTQVNSHQGREFHRADETGDQNETQEPSKESERDPAVQAWDDELRGTLAVKVGSSSSSAVPQTRPSNDQDAREDVARTMSELRQLWSRHDADVVPSPQSESYRLFLKTSNRDHSHNTNA
eukprot:m.137723 g.137723  ORF g.137723 m.137723 type:complete len:819 (-) comp15900_c0_seq2:1674-4130(-)